MKLHEAIETGKRIKRLNDLGYRLQENLTHVFYSYADVIAEDWEVEELSTIITKTQYKSLLLEAHTHTQEDETVARWMNTTCNNRYWEKVLGRLQYLIFKEDT